MPGKRYIAGVISFISALILLVIILLTAIQIQAFNLDFFESEYEKMATAKSIGMTKEELMVTTQELLSYIKGQRDDLKIEAVIKGEKQQVFNQREMDHMVDVQQLYQKAYWVRTQGIILFIFLIALLIALTGSKFPRIWAGGYLAGAAVFIVLAGAAAAAVRSDFLWFWNNFHYLVFSNDLWILNPQEDILIQMVPEQFFFNLVLRILISCGIGTIVLTLLAGFILFKTKKAVYTIL